MPEKFKLTEEMITEIEEKVNNCISDLNNSAREKLVFPDHSFISACLVTVEVRTGKVQVIDLIQDCNGDEEYTDNYYPELW